MKNLYCRCKACNRPFYPVWRSDIEEFEDLCHVCLPVAMEAVADFEEDVYGVEVDTVYAEDVFVEYDELSDDDYHSLGEEAMGDFGNLMGFDSYDR